MYVFIPCLILPPHWFFISRKSRSKQIMYQNCQTATILLESETCTCYVVRKTFSLTTGRIFGLRYTEGKIICLLYRKMRKFSYFLYLCVFKLNYSYNKYFQKMSYVTKFFFKYHKCVVPNSFKFKFFIIKFDNMYNCITFCTTFCTIVQCLYL